MDAVIQSIKGAFAADAYSLGAHWVYDQEQLKALPIDWERLNAPQAMWHKGKQAGDMTHYGDHTLWLLEYVAQNRSFDVEGYAEFWMQKIKSYTGYIDASSQETLAHLKAKEPAACGVASHDLSICGRIAVLLLVTQGDDFISKAVMFAKMTHNDPLVLEAVHFFATLLVDAIEQKSIVESIQSHAKNYSPTLKAWIEAGLKSREQESFEAIRAFGPACGVDGGFQGVIHLLSRYKSLKEALRANAQAGGDSSARGMIVGMLLGAQSKEIAWFKELNRAKEIEKLIHIARF